MVTISENLKAIDKKLREILRKQSSTDANGLDVDGLTPTHIWVMGNHSKSRCPLSPQGGEGDTIFADNYPKIEKKNHDFAVHVQLLTYEEYHLYH